MSISRESSEVRTCSTRNMSLPSTGLHQTVPSTSPLRAHQPRRTPRLPCEPLTRDVREAQHVCVVQSEVKKPVCRVNADVDLNTESARVRLERIDILCQLPVVVECSERLQRRVVRLARRGVGGLVEEVRGAADVGDLVVTVRQCVNVGEERRVNLEQQEVACAGGAQEIEAFEVRGLDPGVGFVTGFVRPPERLADVIDAYGSRI